MTLGGVPVAGRAACCLVLVCLTAACYDFEQAPRRPVEIGLQAPPTALAGTPATFRISTSAVEPESVEVIDQQLGIDLLLATAQGVGPGIFEATWQPELPDEGPYLLRAKVLLRSEGVALSETVAMQVQVVEPFAKKGPGGLAAAADGSQVTLTWDSVQHATGYYIYRDGQPAFTPSPQNRIADVTQTAHVDTDVVPGATYHYRVTSYVAAKRTGNVRESGPSDAVVVTVPVAPDSTPPAVAIVAPDTDQTYSVAQTVTVAAQAGDDVGVTKVEFYDNGELRGSDSEVPFTLSWSFTGADNGAHLWTAKAFDAAGNSATSAPRTLTVQIQSTDTTAPTVTISAPAANATYTSPQTVVVSAAASDNVAVSKVEFYDGATLKAVDTTSPYSFSWTFLAADNGSHAWTAKAVDAAGNSATSAVRLLTVSIPVLPAAPTGVQAAAGDGKNTVSWSAVAGATGYNLYWATTAGVTPTTGNKLAGVSSPYVHGGLSDGVTYYYVVAAFNSAGVGPGSAQVSATPKPAPDTVSPTFAGLATATATSSSQIKLSWSPATDNVTPAAGLVYEIYKSLSPSVSFAAPSFTTGPGATSYTVGGLAASTTYHFVVRARDAAGNQETNTVVKSATTEASVPTGPVPPFGSTVGMTAADFTVTDCANNPFNLHSQFDKYPATVLLFNWTGFT